MTSHLRPSEQDPADRPYEKNEMSWALSWAGPRTVLVPRTDQGFGFTLRHFIVYPPESASDHGPEGEIFTDENDPEGRRVKRTKLSSLEPMDTIFVKHVKDGGPAHQAGLNTGDRIVSVNGEPVTGKSYSQVIHLIQSSDSALKLLVVPKDEDILQMAYQTSVYDKSQESYRGYGDSMTSASQGNYVKVEHTGLAPTTEVTVTSRRGGWREELRKKYSTPIEESGYDPRTVSWQGGVSTREPLRTDSATNRGVDGRKGGFDIHISYNYPVSKTQSTYAAPTSPQKSSGYGLYYPVVRRDSRDRTDPPVGSQSRSNSNSSSNLSARHSQEIVVDTTGSQENVEKPHRWSRGSQDYSRSSQENMSYSRRSKEGLQFPDDSYTPSYSSNRSHTWDSSKFQSRPSHSSSENNVPRSLTTSSLSKMTNPTKVVDYTVPDSSNSGSNLKPVRYSVSTGSSSSTSSLPQNVSPTRLIQYNPPSAQSHRSAKSTSADNLQNAGGLSVHRANTGSSKPAHSVSNTRLRDYQEPKIPGRTFVVRIGDKVTVSPPPSQSQRDPVSINSTRTYPSGTTFALTRAPTATNSPYESRKNPQLPVSERKKQFEAGKRMEEIQAPASVTPPNYEMSASTKRYKTEIEKLQSLGKLGIVKRVAQFESSNSNSDSGESTPTRTEQTPPPQEVSPQNLYQQQTRTQQSPPTQYSAVQHESCSVPQYSVVQQQHYQPVQQQQHQHSPVLQQQQQYIPTLQPAIKVRKIATERYQPSDSTTNSRPNSLGTSVPVRVLMSHSTSAPNSPTVEEGKSIEDGVRAGSMRSVDPHGMSVSMVNPPLRMDSVEGTFLSAEKGGSSNSSRPVRKVSYLTAVNAPISKQEDITILSSSPRITLNGQSHNFDLEPESGRLDLVSSVCSVTSHSECSTSHKRSRSSFSFFSNATSGLLSAFTTLTAVMTASSENLDRAGCKSDQPSPHPHGDSMVSPAATSPVHKSASTSNVVMRKKTEAAEEEGIKLHRRTSYLMATAKDRTTLTLPLNKTAPPNTQDLHTSPSKSINLKKLKLKFGEKTPRITEGQEGGKRLSQDLNSPIQEVVKEGILHCKTAITDGKRASDRSWKPMWAVLKGHALYLVHARKDGSWNANDEQLISIKSCLVDIANDYTKKKHVFRLKTYNGCEYLLQADDGEAMAEWISAIQSNNDPDGDEKGVVMTDFMLRKTTQYEQTTNNTSKTSPQTQPKSKKLSGLSFKAKMPYSPNVKRKKPPDDGARSKTWKGKFKSFRPRLGGGATSNAEEETTPTGTFGVPLEDCVPSPNNEFVPLIVEICTKIVELRGVEVVGIYRVPGNTAAVHMMQDELNRGFENMSSENEKWLDVNVISSLLKAFFRKLPEPLITEDLYQSFINANRADDPMRRMLSLKRLLHELPEHHFETFKHLAAHLKLVAIHGEQNKMDSRNLAIVFGPTLIRRKDEDMATLVKDMSDQCRIVESVIVNNEWFFSSWEEDSVVPDDDGTIVNAPVSSSKNLLAKLAMNEDDRGREVNPKDIVFSIIQAANKKLKGKDKKYSLGALDDGDLSSECGPNERNIDQEVARRRAKSEEILTQDSASESTSTSSASKSFDHQDTMPMDHHDTYPFSLSMGAVSTDRVPAIGAEDYMDWVFVRTQSDSQPVRQGGTSRPQVLNRHYSEDSLLDKNDEIEISHGSLHNNCSLSRDRLDRLWRLEQEARALRETEERRQREREKHRREQQRIEQELARTKKELEIEESHSLEDILRHTEFAMQISDFANRLGDFGGRGLNQPDSSSLLSEYSTTSSDNKDVKFFLPRPGEGGSRTGCASRSDLEPGVAAVSAIPRHMLSSYEDRQGQMGKRAGSLETIIDGKCNNGKRSSGRWKGKRDGDRGACPKSPEQADGKAVALVRSSSVRRGSLDSLRDFYDKQDHRSSWASTDSEDGSDLLTSLTTTFDQKLQILLNPKFKLTGAAKKQLSQAESTGSGSTVSDSTEEREVTRLGATAQVAPAAAIKVVPPMRPEETNVSRTLPPRPSVEHSVSQRLSRQGDPSYDRSFRDPSLHRMHHRPDAKIGIASRFERGSSISSSTVPTSSVNQMSQSTSSLPSGSTGLQYRPFLSYREKPDSSTVKGVPGEATSQKLSASQGGQIRGEAKPFNVRSDSRPKTKSEKTEVNLSLSKLSKEEQNDKAAGDARKSTDLSKTSSTASGTKSGSVDNLENNAASGATVFVPHSPKKKDRRSARRHTVCGINDSEHLCAMAQLSQSKDDDPKLSAWEQLRPAVKPASEEEAQTLISWLQKERLRMSASDLLGAENRTLSSSCSNLDETRC